MEKPISLAKRELIEKMTKLLEESNVPLIVLEPLIKDLYIQIQQSCIQNSIMEEKEYNKFLAESKEINE